MVGKNKHYYIFEHYCPNIVISGQFWDHKIISIVNQINLGSIIDRIAIQIQVRSAKLHKVKLRISGQLWSIFTFFLQTELWFWHLNSSNLYDHVANTSKYSKTAVSTWIDSSLYNIFSHYLCARNIYLCISVYYLISFMWYESGMVISHNRS